MSNVPTLQYVECRNTGKTKEWKVWCDITVLGRVKWYAAWRRYCFFPSAEVLFDRNCLAQVVAFIDERMLERHGR
jgi:hypothetical protein